MNVKELVKWLSTLEDQEAEVEVVVHSSGTGYYDQGGNATTVKFDPEIHYEYTDFRGNQFVPVDAPYANTRTILLGQMNT